MKLKIFNFIDDSIAMMEENMEEIEEIALSLNHFFEESFSYNDHFSQIVYRIKSPKSLKEKILRNNFYAKYKTPEVLFKNLKDLMGFRMECRFIDEEVLLYQDLLRLFNVEVGNGFFTNQLNPNIEMNLSMPQPQTLQNDSKVYKIDARYHKNDKYYNFELQIKSMVNVFWSEIEHKILYKNFNYVITEQFYREMMGSIKENLTMIDQQLMLVYQHLQSIEASSISTTKTQTKAMLSKLIHDMFVVRVYQQTGLMLEFKYPADLLVDFLFYKSILLQRGLGEQSIAFINRLNEISNMHLDLTSYVEIPKWQSFHNEIEEELAQKIAESINQDYKWNLFFRILFLFEEEEKRDEQFREFVHFVYQTWTFRTLRGMGDTPLSARDKKDLVGRFCRMILVHWSESRDIDFFNVDAMREIERKVAKFLEIMERPEDIWSLDFENFYEML